MHRLLIVDDEPVILDGLALLFQNYPDEELDICRAASAAQALVWLEKARIDVVITDIRMPGVSGIQLCDRIKSRWPRCQVIFLTGYASFEDVYRAGKQQGIRYLLKTERDEVVVDAVRQAISELEKDNESAALLQQAETRYEAAIPWLRDAFLREMTLQGPPERLRAHFSHYKLAFKEEENVLLLLARIDPGEAPPDNWVETARLILDKCAPERCVHACAPLDGEKLLWLLQPTEGKTISELSVDAAGEIETVQALFLQTCGRTLSLAMGGGAIAWEEAPVRTLALKRLFSYHADAETFLTLPESEEDSRDARKQEEACRRLTLERTRISALEKLLDGGEDVTVELNDILDKLQAVAVCGEELAAEAYFSLALFFLTYINQRGLTEALRGRIETGLLSGARDSWDATRSYMLRLASCIQAIQSEKRKTVTAEPVERVCRHIEAHLSEDLSLVRLAELAYVNPSYLSRLFKQATGMNLSAYIAQARIWRAKALLNDPDKKIAFVGSAIGYPSAPCFARFFRKATGQSPQEYRDARLHS